MKTITTLLLTSFLLAGTFNTVLAGEDARRENAPRPRNEIKIKREVIAERTREVRGYTTRSNTERRMLVRRNENERRYQPRLEARIFQRRPNFNPRIHLSFHALSVNACPVCYNPLHDGQLDCSLEDLAWMETNRIAQALELSDHQRSRVFEINYRYITHRYNGEYYPTNRRDREIRHILHLGQVIAFAILLNELHEGEVCYNCSNEAY
jgi:hypothetical protein